MWVASYMWYGGVGDWWVASLKLTYTLMATVAIHHAKWRLLLDALPVG